MFDDGNRYSYIAVATNTQISNRQSLRYSTHEENQKKKDDHKIQSNLLQREITEWIQAIHFQLQKQHPNASKHPIILLRMCAKCSI